MKMKVFKDWKTYLPIFSSFGPNLRGTSTSSEGDWKEIGPFPVIVLFSEFLRKRLENLELTKNGYSIQIQSVSENGGAAKKSPRHRPAPWEKLLRGDFFPKFFKRQG
jgi:hypothetical protein